MDLIQPVFDNSIQRNPTLELIQSVLTIFSNDSEHGLVHSVLQSYPKKAKTGVSSIRFDNLSVNTQKNEFNDFELDR